MRCRVQFFAPEQDPCRLVAERSDVIHGANADMMASDDPECWLRSFYLRVATRLKNKEACHLDRRQRPSTVRAGLNFSLPLK